MRKQLFVVAMFVPLLLSCNSKADRQALKEEVKAELQAEQTAQENERLKDELQQAKDQAAAAQASATQAKAEAKAAKQNAAKQNAAPARRAVAVSATPINMTHVKISNLRGLTNLRNAPNGSVCMQLKAYVDYDIYVSGIYNGWYQIAEIYRPDGSRVNLHSSNTGWWIARNICYVD